MGHSTVPAFSARATSGWGAMDAPDDEANPRARPAMSNSTVFTIGSALRQAENDGVPVRLMVDGEWFDGEVAGLDGDGVLLESPDGEVVVRLTSISVVRLVRMAQEAQPAPVAAAPAPTPTPAPAPATIHRTTHEETRTQSRTQ